VNKLFAFTLISLGLALGAASMAQAQSDEESGIEIKQIKVIGLRYLDESAVLSALTIKQGDVLIGNVTAKLNAAGETLKDSGWFQATPVLTLDSYNPDGGDSAPVNPMSEGAVLNVKVDENPRYNSTTIEGNTLFSDERLLEEVDGKPAADGQTTGARMVRGEVINTVKLGNALRSVLRVYDDAGYIAAGIQGFTFSTKDIPPSDGQPEVHAGDVTVQLTEGKVEEVIVVGLEHTKERIVDSQITHMQPDTILTRQALDKDLSQIYNTGLFESVTPSMEPSLKEGYAKVVLTVVEAKTGQVGFGLGYSSVNGVQGSVNYSQKNLFGSGKQLATSVTFSDKKPSIDLTYTDRFFTDHSFWSLGLYSIHNKEQRFPGTAYESELSANTEGASLGYGEKVSDDDTWQVSVGVADYSYQILKGDPFFNYNARQRARLSASGQTRKVTGAYTHDTRDNIFSSTDGVYAQLATDVAGFGGDFSFNKWTAETREFIPAGSGTLALRQRLGLATGHVPIYEEYVYGGTSSVRGLPEDDIFGTHSYLNNVEYRYKVNSTIGLTAFLDSAWAGDSFSSMTNATGAGLGMRVKLSFLGNQAVRLDYGWPLAGAPPGTSNQGHFHFFLGEMF
jgi:outer membrane protein insertion porin family